MDLNFFDQSFLHRILGVILVSTPIFVIIWLYTTDRVQEIFDYFKSTISEFLDLLKNNKMIVFLSYFGYPVVLGFIQIEFDVQFRWYIYLITVFFTCIVFISMLYSIYSEENPN